MDIDVTLHVMGQVCLLGIALCVFIILFVIDKAIPSKAKSSEEEAGMNLGKIPGDMGVLLRSRQRFLFIANACMACAMFCIGGGMSLGSVVVGIFGLPAILIGSLCFYILYRIDISIKNIPASNSSKK